MVRTFARVSICSQSELIAASTFQRASVHRLGGGLDPDRLRVQVAVDV